MTRNIRLSFGTENAVTEISNIFIDNFMAEAHGTYVKVYIYLLRCLSDPNMSVSIADIAEKLDETEKDICKALKYWEKKKLLKLRTDREGQISNITITDLNAGCEEETGGYSDSVCDYDDYAAAPAEPVQRSKTSAGTQKTAARKSISEEPAEESGPATAPEFSKPSYSAKQMESLRTFEEFNRLIDDIENLLGKVLTHKDLQTPCFLFECLGFSTDLIRYLYDYCISKGKKSAAYIEKVAREWADRNIDTVEKAEAETLTRCAQYNAVRSTFGITRALGAPELSYIRTWVCEYGFDAELIAEACSRTLLNTGKPDFKYANRILADWHNAQVSSIEDVAGLDKAHSAKAPARNTRTAAAPRSGQFGQFPQRAHSEEEYSDLERKKLNQI